MLASPACKTFPTDGAFSDLTFTPNCSGFWKTVGLVGVLGLLLNPVPSDPLEFSLVGL